MKEDIETTDSETSCKNTWQKDAEKRVEMHTPRDTFNYPWAPSEWNCLQGWYVKLTFQVHPSLFREAENPLVQEDLQVQILRVAHFNHIRVVLLHGHCTQACPPSSSSFQMKKTPTMLSKFISWHWLISRTGLLFLYWWEWVRREIRFFLELLNTVENFTFHYSYPIKTLAIKLWLGSLSWRCCLLSDYLQNGDYSQMAKKED